MPASEPKSIGIVNRFRLDRAVALSGRTGVVVEAVVDPETPRARRVALTLMEPGLVVAAACIERWGIATAATHPVFVSPVEFGELGRIPYVATAWQDGWTLGEIAHAAAAGGGNPTPRMLASVGLDVAEALRSLAHCVGTHHEPMPLVHGRLGPQRVLVTATGSIRLLGFPGRAADLAHLDLDGVELFQAPAQQRGAPPTLVSDVHALAQVLLGMGGADASPRLKGVLTEALEGRPPEWLAANLQQALLELGGPLAPADWRVVLTELPLPRATESAAARRLAEQLVARAAEGSGPNRPPASVVPGMLFAVACGLATSFGIHEYRSSHAPPALEVQVSSAAEVSAPAVAVAAAPDPSPPGIEEAPDPAPAAPVAAPPAPAADAAAGASAPRLVVRSNPDGVVYVDGEPVGTTPLDTADVGVGRHTVEVRLAGYKSDRREVTLGAGRTGEISVHLEPAVAGTGALTVRSTPPSVVYVDGEPLGTTPIEASPLMATHHVVELKLGGHTTERREIQVRKGQTVSIDVQLHPVQ